MTCEHTPAPSSSPTGAARTPRIVSRQPGLPRASPTVQFSQPCSAHRHQLQSAPPRASPSSQLGLASRIAIKSIPGLVPTTAVRRRIEERDLTPAVNDEPRLPSYVSMPSVEAGQRQWSDQARESTRHEHRGQRANRHAHVSAGAHDCLSPYPSPTSRGRTIRERPRRNLDNQYQQHSDTRTSTSLAGRVCGLVFASLLAIMLAWRSTRCVG